MGPTADMSTMLNKINNNPEYEDINDEVDFDLQKQWFKDLQENWVEVRRSLTICILGRNFWLLPFCIPMRYRVQFEEKVLKVDSI